MAVFERALRIKKGDHLKNSQDRTFEVVLDS
jgi:hypothetical protein